MWCPCYAGVHLGKVRLFLDGEDQGFRSFIPKEELALSCIKFKKTPDPPLFLVTDKSACMTLPSLLHGMFHAIDYISILNVYVLKQENVNNQCEIFMCYS